MGNGSGTDDPGRVAAAHDPLTLLGDAELIDSILRGELSPTQAARRLLAGQDHTERDVNTIARALGSRSDARRQELLGDRLPRFQERVLELIRSPARPGTFTAEAQAMREMVPNFHRLDPDELFAHVPAAAAAAARAPAPAPAGEPAAVPEPQPITETATETEIGSALGQEIGPAIAAPAAAEPALPTAVASPYPRSSAGEEPSELIRFQPRSQADLAPSGATARIRANLAALNIRATLAAENRPATAEEQAVLGRWSSWGAVAQQMFAQPDYAWARDELAELLTEEELAAARRTTLNAHFTDAGLVMQVWRAVGELGFDEGQVLEPGCGSGNFIGFAPDGARIVGVELDPVTADIARALYPQAIIRSESFAKTRAAHGRFDLVVGNVPFDKHVEHDPVYNSDRFTIHNHFLHKSVQMTRPGGLIAVITSRYTMDSADSLIRDRLAGLADLVGAVRLPSGAHRRAAGTDVVTDLLILRRREPGREPDKDTKWKAVLDVDVDGEALPVNEYFAAHPELVLGQLRAGHGLHSSTDLVVEGPADASLLLGDALDRIIASARSRNLTWVPAPAEYAVPVAFVDPNATIPDRFIQAHADGSFTQMVFGVEQPFTVPGKGNQAIDGARELRALLSIRDTVLDLLTQEAASSVATPQMDATRLRLNQQYDAYVRSYGPINRFKLTSAGARQNPSLGGFRSDAFAQLVRALETYDAESGTAAKAEIFHERAQLPRQAPDKADNPADAIAMCLDRHGELRLAVVADLLGLSEQDARAALDTLVFDEPFTGRLVPAGEYLSGNVRTKHAQALTAAASDRRFAVNVTALAEVIPPDIEPGEIEVQLGASWVDASYVQEFLRETLNDRHLSVDHPGGSLWRVHSRQKGSLEATEQWGTKDYPAPELAETLLRREPIQVWRTNRVTGERTLDEAATSIAAAKAAELDERFGEWVWQDPERATVLSRKYNDEFNGTVERQYSGSHLSLPGLAMNFSPRAHQTDAVARIIASPAVGLFHEVGAGKTTAMIAGAMELRRLGLANKPVIVTPKNVLDGFAREFLQRYPRAKLLVGYAEDTNAAERRTFIGRAATGNWDAVLMSKEAFQLIPMPRAVREAYLRKAVGDIAGAIATAENADMEETTVKELERAKARAEERVERQLDKAKDDGVEFNLTGIDYAIIDEAHYYKNLYTVSAIRDMAIEGSGIALDLHMKLDYLRENYPRVATLATATPVTRSLAEIYNWMRYLDPTQLTDRGITSFDQFLATFTTTKTDFELSITGGLKLKTRTADIINAPELVAMFRSVSDIKTAEELKLPVPLIARREDGQRLPAIIAVPCGPRSSQVNDELNSRAQNIGRREKGADNHLVIVNEGKKAAVDLRLLGREPDDYTKINAAVPDKVAAIYHETKNNEYLTVTGQPSPHKGAFQLVFLDLGVPGDGKDRHRWSAYEALRDEFAARGVPADKVRFIHEAGNNEYRKGQMFDDCNNGRIAVLIASTSKAGVGTNIQTRMIAMHHVDCTWNPTDLQQRNGRGLRQRNQNPEIYIFNYVAEGSFDAYVYQTVERKARMISPVMSGKLTSRRIEDFGEVALSLAEIKALAAGNQLLLDLNKAETELKKLERLHRNHDNGQRTIRHTIKGRRQDAVIFRAGAAEYEAAIAARTPTRGDAFTMTIGETRFTKRPDAEARLHEVVAGLRPGSVKQPVGSIGGMTLLASATSLHDKTARKVTFSFEQATLSEVTLFASGLGDNGKPVSILTRLENRLAEFEAQRDAMIMRAENAEADVRRAEDQIGRPFRYTDELAAARERFKELKAELAEQQKQQQQDKQQQQEEAGATAQTPGAPPPEPHAPDVDGQRPPFVLPPPKDLGGPPPPVHPLDGAWDGDITAALQVAVAVISLHGFTSRREADKAAEAGVPVPTTAELVDRALADELDGDLRDQLRQVMTPATAYRAALIHQWAREQRGSGDSFLTSFAELARAHTNSVRALSTLAAGVHIYNKHEQVHAAAITAASAWQGSQRQPLTVEATVLAVVATAGRAGPSTTVTLADDHGNLYSWTGNHTPKAQPGQRGTLTGVVNAHRLAASTKETAVHRGEWQPQPTATAQAGPPAPSNADTVNPVQLARTGQPPAGHALPASQPTAPALPPTPPAWSAHR